MNADPKGKPHEGKYDPTQRNTIFAATLGVGAEGAGEWQ
jgi:hypothetical protein